MTVQVLDEFAAGGLISAPKERARPRFRWSKSSTSSPPISTSRSAGSPAATSRRRCWRGASSTTPRRLLIDEPTQGVDAKARFDIYRAIRAKADQGVACVINSSDAMELAGLCDRVLVFSRGRIIRELERRRNHRGEHRLLLPALEGSRRAANKARSRRAAACLVLHRHLRQLSPAAATNGGCRCCSCCLLIVAVGCYATLRTDVFLTPLNIRHILLATAPLALVTMAQFNVLMVRGFDVSVGRDHEPDGRDRLVPDRRGHGRRAHPARVRWSALRPASSSA